MQDAVLRFEDIRYLKKQHVFALAANRFAWEADQPLRRRAGLHVENVLAVHQHGIRPDPELILSLLAIGFETTDAPAGVVVFHFSAGFSIRLTVEYLSLHVKDLGPEWPAEHKPHHDI